MAIYSDSLRFSSSVGFEDLMGSLNSLGYFQSAHSKPSEKDIYVIEQENGIENCLMFLDFNKKTITFNYKNKVEMFKNKANVDLVRSGLENIAQEAWA